MPTIFYSEHDFDDTAHEEQLEHLNQLGVHKITTVEDVVGEFRFFIEEEEVDMRVRATRIGPNEFRALGEGRSKIAAAEDGGRKILDAAKKAGYDGVRNTKLTHVQQESGNWKVTVEAIAYHVIERDK
jgi:hypothetical protein